MDCANAPDYLKRAEQDQNQIGEIDARIRELSSKPIYNEISNLFDQIAKIYNGPHAYTYRIKTITEKVGEIQKLLTEISYSEYQEKIADRLKGVAKNLAKYEKDRYEEYQKWALGKLIECLNTYNSYIFVNAAKSDDLFQNIYWISIPNY